ncbi:MAG: hypothetical protein M3131_07285, partial [Actinomycetota bacterium]|nr:hypothetical protein [Actinomycetota bacterium]
MARRFSQLPRPGLAVLVVGALITTSIVAPSFGAPASVSATSLGKRVAKALKLAKRADKNAKTALAKAGARGPAGT